MKLIYTRHAKVRMLQREISEEQIESLVGAPDTIKDSIKERVVARKKSDRGILEIIYKESFNEIVIITCYWVKKE